MFCEYLILFTFSLFLSLLSYVILESMMIIEGDSFMKHTRPDLVFLTLLVSVGLLLAGYIYLPAHPTGKFLEIRIDGKVTATYPLSEDRKQQIQTDDGHTNTFTIENGIVYMKDASCPDQICVHTKGISKSGETIVCLPHKVVLAIVDSTQTSPSLDGISG